MRACSPCRATPSAVPATDDCGTVGCVGVWATRWAMRVGRNRRSTRDRARRTARRSGCWAARAEAEDARRPARVRKGRPARVRKGRRVPHVRIFAHRPRPDSLPDVALAAPTPWSADFPPSAKLDAPTRVLRRGLFRVAKTSTPVPRLLALIARARCVSCRTLGAPRSWCEAGAKSAARPAANPMRSKDHVAPARPKPADASWARADKRSWRITLRAIRPRSSPAHVTRAMQCA